MLNIKTILVPVDFSEASKMAATYGLTLAGQLNARLILAHVVPDATALTYAVPPEGYSLQQAQYEAARRDIQLIIPARSGSGADVETVVEIGDVESKLLDIIRNQRADLVVTATHGRRFPGRWLLGSVTEHILRKVEVPVLTVSHVEEDSKRIELGLDAVKNVLFATDLSDESEIGLQYAVGLAHTAGARLTVLHVAPHMDLLYWSGAVAGYLESDREKYIENINARLRQFVHESIPADADIETAVLEGKPYETIVRFAEDRSMDIIVLNLQDRKSVV